MIFCGLLLLAGGQLSANSTSAPRQQTGAALPAEGAADCCYSSQRAGTAALRQPVRASRAVIATICNQRSLGSRCGCVFARPALPICGPPAKVPFMLRTIRAVVRCCWPPAGCCGRSCWKAASHHRCTLVGLEHFWQHRRMDVAGCHIKRYALQLLAGGQSPIKCCVGWRSTNALRSRGIPGRCWHRPLTVDKRGLAQAKSSGGARNTRLSVCTALEALWDLPNVARRHIGAHEPCSAVVRQPVTF
jgi:hypothetical protein